MKSRSLGRKRRVVACLTILVIVGTLSACGRYGRPKRPAPEPAVLSFLGR